MRKLVVLIGILILAFSCPAYAQWGGGVKSGGTFIGNTILHKDAIRDADTWYNDLGPASESPSSLELAGYETVRADYNLSDGAGARINFMCSNDSLWMSGSSTAVTDQTYETFELIGCRDYVFYVESLWGADATLTIYLTPYNQD